jgi:hypothetical protein
MAALFEFVRLQSNLKATLTGGPASIEGRSGQLLDISIGGAMIRSEHPPEHRAEPLEIELACAGQEITLLGEERGRQTLPVWTARRERAASDAQPFNRRERTHL